MDDAMAREYDKGYDAGYADAWSDAINFVDGQREDFTDLREVRDRMKNMAKEVTH